MAATLKLEIVTPSRVVFNGDCEEVRLPGIGGEMGILPQHAALVTELSSGLASYRTGGQMQVLALSGGIARVKDDRVTVLAEEARLPDEIDKPTLEKERASVERAILEPAEESEERLSLIQRRHWLDVQLSLIDAQVASK